MIASRHFLMQNFEKNIGPYVMADDPTEIMQLRFHHHRV